MATTAKAPFQPDSDIHITYEDQQKINRFARLNAKLEENKDELKSKQNDLKNMEDAVDELELLDDDEKIPYMFGEVFLLQNVEATRSTLEEAKTHLNSEIKQLEGGCDEVKGIMTDLKTQLYAKFGNNINLDTEED